MLTSYELCCNPSLGTWDVNWSVGDQDTVGVNSNLERLQETFRLNSHAVGRVLTTLGFTNRKRTNAGFTLWLDLESRKQIHNLSRAYAIDRESQFQERGCGDNYLCKNLDASTPASTEEKWVSEVKPKQA